MCKEERLGTSLRAETYSRSQIDITFVAKKKKKKGGGGLGIQFPGTRSPGPMLRLSSEGVFGNGRGRQETLF